MSVVLKVVITTTFNDYEATEAFLKQHAAFNPNQAVELLEEGKLTITEERNMEEIGTTEPTISVFTLVEE